MKTLVLFRHGKSRWDENVTDKKRSLKKSGIIRTQLVAQHLKEILDANDFDVFTSTATRAIQTATIATEIIGLETPIPQEDLYTFSTSELVQWIKKQTTQKDLLLFGHNPAYTHLVNIKTSLQLDNLPTSGVVAITFDIEHWNELDMGELKFILKPKEIKS